MHGSPRCVAGLTVIRGPGLRLGPFFCSPIGVRAYPWQAIRQSMEDSSGNSQEDSNP